MIHTDACGDEMEISGGIYRPTGERFVWIGEYRFTPGEARAIAAEIRQAADVLARPLLRVPAGGEA